MKFFLLSFFILFLTGCIQTPIDDPIDVQTPIELGLAYLNEHDLSNAKTQLLLAEQKAPDNPEVLDSLAYFYQKTNDLQTAETYYQKAVTLNPSSALAKNNYAVFLCRQKRYSEAIYLLQKISQDPDYAKTNLAKKNLEICLHKLQHD